MITLSISKDITTGYKSVTVPLHDVANYTTSYNYSAFLFQNGYRKSANVVSLGNCLIYDFDNGVMTLNKLEQELTNTQIKSLIVTSKSHQKEKNGKPACDRFRLFVPLSDNLTIEKNRYSAFYMFMAHELNIQDAIDIACKDTARFYFPNLRQEIKIIETGRTQCIQTLQEKFALYNEKVNVCTQRRHIITRKGSNEISLDTEIHLSNNKIRLLRDFSYLYGDDTVSCRCLNPAHEDKSPSAFVGRSRTGNSLQVTCRVCGYTVYGGGL